MLPHNQSYHIASYRERRKYVRFNEGRLTAWIKRRGLLREFIKGEPVQWFNFNQYGMAFASLIHLQLHEEILIDLHADQQKINNLVAIVHNARRQAGIYRYGVQFYFGANSHMRTQEISDMLGAIEASLA